MVNISEVEKESGTFNQAIRVGGFSSTRGHKTLGFNWFSKSITRCKVLIG